MNKITLYTTGCPQCIELKKILDKNKIEYSVENDISKMLSLGIQSAPRLEVNGKIMGMQEALSWVERH